MPDSLQIVLALNKLCPTVKCQQEMFHLPLILPSQRPPTPACLPSLSLCLSLSVSPLFSLSLPPSIVLKATHRPQRLQYLLPSSRC